jgi:hypothetical protein
MTIDKISKGVLRYLFQEYLKGPTIQYSINRITDLSKADASEVGNYMLEKQWIRELWIHQNNSVTCRIAIAGIEEVNPAFIHTRVKNLITELVEGGGRKSLMEIFQHKIQEYAIALDIVYQLEKLGLVSITHRGENIFIELTAAGWKYSEAPGRSLLALMSVA